MHLNKQIQFVPIMELIIYPDVSSKKPKINFNDDSFSLLAEVKLDIDNEVSITNKEGKKRFRNISSDQKLFCFNFSRYQFSK